jgi:DNA-binding NtrC family response regulator
MAKILIIDDEKAIRNTLREILEYEGYQIEEASNGEEGIQKIEADDFDMVLCDVKMPKMDGMAVLSKVKEIDEDLPIVMISGHGNVEMAVEATKKGAYDFIVKPPDLNKLLIIVRNSIDKKELVVETKVLRRRASKTRDIIGESPAIKNILDTIDKVAPTDARVLITGENGTGKELVARWIHEKSMRSKQALIEVNCAAIPTELIESELFGHEKGAFTSAIKQRIGKFEQAHTGTIFLDEVGDMSLSAQAKVLRALQENKITRVGGEKDIEVDVRVIAATNKNLLKEIEKGNFRMDLYHRISVILIHVPSLHDRRDDIPLLADKFIKEICEDGGLPKKSFMPQALEEFKKLNFSGNIRELRNIVERLVILGQTRISVEDIQKFASPINARDEEKSIYERFSTLQDFKEYVKQHILIICILILISSV